MKREQSAQLIYDCIKEYGRISGRGIRIETGLSPMQFQYGKGLLLDEFQTKNGRPLIYSPYRGVYSLTEDEGEWMDYLLDWRFKSICTQLQRTEQTALAGGMLFGTRKKQIKILIAAIQAVKQMAEAIREKE